MKQLSLCTYNILAQSYIRHNIREGRKREFCQWSYRGKLLENFLRSQNHTSILGLQEVEPEVAKEFQSSLPSHQFFYSQRPQNPDGLLLILHPQLQLDNFLAIPLHNEAGIQRRIAQIADCTFMNKQFRLVNLHLDFDSRGRNNGFVQMEQVLTQLNKQESKPTLIFGDFNITARRRTFAFIAEKGFSYVDTFLPTCYTGRWSRVDHVFYTPDVHINKLEIPELQDSKIPNEDWGSDHLPISCTFELGD